MHFKWVKRPRHLAQQIERYGEKILIAVHAVAVYVGTQMQDQARNSAPWQDRTGNARSGIFFAVDGFGLQTVVGQVTAAALSQVKGRAATVAGAKDRLVIVLGHTVYYGKYLELAHGGRYAVVMATVEQNIGVLERMLHNLLK